MTTSTPRRAAVISLTGSALAIAALAGASTASAATPATLTLDGVTQRSQTVTTTTTVSGRTVTAGLGLFQVTVAPGGQPAIRTQAFCDEPLVGISGGVKYSVQLQRPADSADLGGPAYRAASYLIRTAEARIAAAADPRLESGAHQVAVWQLGGRIVTTNPTTSPAMNARAAALRAEALATADRTPGATAGAQACAGSGQVQVTVTGAPGANARISVTEGTATTPVGSVNLDATGTATVRVTAAAPGRSVVRVSLDTATLVRAARVAGATGPQQTVLLMPERTSFDVPVVFTDCTSTPGVQPGGGNDTPPVITPNPSTPGSSSPGSTTPTPAPLQPEGQKPTDPTPPAGGSTPAPQLQRPGLSISKTAPRRVGLGKALRFRLVVRNTGQTELSGVVVTDPIPDGVFVSNGSGTAKRLRAGSVVFDVGRLAPGAKRTFIVDVRTLTDRTGRVCNVASVQGTSGSGANTRTLRDRARACTTVVGRPREIVPSVTA